MTQKYFVEELDGETRDYLLLARDKEGKGVPGIYAGKSNYLPMLGLAFGFLAIIATLILTVPPTEHPIKEAMLQTAGFMLGGWMILAAIRVWIGGKSGRYAGHFIYADPENLYEAKGQAVEITALDRIRDAKAVQNFNNGSYQSTSITVKVGHDWHTVQVSDEERGRRMTVFLNSVCYMRDGGEDGNDDGLRNLSPEAMGAVAKQVARTGQFPTDPRSAEEDEGIRVPRPRKERRRSTGLLGMLVTLVIGSLMFVALWQANTPLRDHAVFEQIKGLSAKDQPPALRLYLANDKFTAHRDEAQKLLDTHYENGVRNNVAGTDADMKAALAAVILSLKSKPAPVVFLVVGEEQSPVGQEWASGLREKAVQMKLADKWGSTIGDELVVFATPEDPDKPNQMDKASKGMIDLRWKFTPQGPIEYTIEFRTSPDEEPILRRQLVFSRFDKGNVLLSADDAIQALVDLILNQSVGITKLRPTPPPDDF